MPARVRIDELPPEARERVRAKTGTIRGKPVLLEAAIQLEILRRAKEELKITLVPTDAGAYRRASRGKVGRPGLPKGWPDLTGYHPRNGRIIVLEVKRPGKKPTKEQTLWILAVEGAGGYASWTDDVDGAIAWLSGLIR